MNDAQQKFLTLLGRLPARLTAEQVSWVLNCQPHDVPVLVAARLLKPLGNPLPNCVKYFATAEVIDLMGDRPWLAKVTTAVSQYWQKKNRQKLTVRINNFPGSPPPMSGETLNLAETKKGGTCEYNTVRS